MSMDGSGKLIWARHNDVVSAIIKGGGECPQSSMGSERGQCADKVPQTPPSRTTTPSTSPPRTSARAKCIRLASSILPMAVS